MLIEFIKKKIIKEVAKDVVKSIPTIKEQGLKLINEHKTEVIGICKNAIRVAVKDFINKKLNK